MALPISNDTLTKLLAALEQDRGEHWITFRVDGPGSASGDITIRLPNPEVRVLDETHVPYLQAQLAAINRFRLLHQMQDRRLHWFDIRAWTWSDSVNRFRGVVG